LRTFALTLAYDGTHYAGWQIQPNGLAVQQVLTEVVSKVVGHPIVVQGSGRTDAGVHAVGQVAAFSTPAWSPPADRFVQAINGLLPRDITVLECAEMVPPFDPIRDATGKRYRYVIRTSRVPDPILHRYHWWIPRPLDLEAMRLGADHLIGTHDFKAFESLGSNRKTSVRTVRELTLATREAMSGIEVWLEIEADGFLYNMVRNIVGALVAVGRGRSAPERIATMRESRARVHDSQTAPARGLVLLRVDYPESAYLAIEEG
jgi:tRNA pseudouridine38-40 synthase